MRPPYSCLTLSSAERKASLSCGAPAAGCPPPVPRIISSSQSFAGWPAGCLGVPDDGAVGDPPAWEGCPNTERKDPICFLRSATSASLAVSFASSAAAFPSAAFRASLTPLKRL